MKKNIYSVVVASFLATLTFQSCFQDMERPEFNYPSSTVKEYSPIKLELPFDDDIRDKGNYGFTVYSDGNSKFADGINGKAYQGATKTYIVAKQPAYLKDSIPELGSFTVAFWMKSTKNTTASGLFTLTNTTQFWGNIDIMLENNSSDTEAFFKVNLQNAASGTIDQRWITPKIENVFGDKWVHMAFCYDGNTSVFKIYKDGQEAVSQELEGYGKLKFKDVGPIVVGGFQFSPTPSLTTGASDVDWAGTYTGLLDQFHFYDKAISAADVLGLYNNKE